MNLKLTLTTSEGTVLEAWDLDELSYGGEIICNEEVTEQAKIAADYITGSGWFVKPEFE
ncbi:hypothetical protein LCGC14_0947150 [marine sediment metagenome]|uniref:Uncharacterized protein n=1 Tax=marine sediment metagenome TaxID=412755 RepID=A0A0F9R1Y9_9ZZZZ